MKVLAVDTATAWQTVALLDGADVLARHDEYVPGAHARTLLPTIDRLLTKTGLSLFKLDGLVVSIGPGSFTGLRVGLATMLGFRTISQLPLAVVPTLEAMAWNLRGSPTPLCPILNSRKGELYWALFRWTDEQTVERLLPEQVGTAAKLSASLVQPVCCYGEGWDQESTAIRAVVPSHMELLEAPETAAKPSAVSVGLAGIARLTRGERAGLGIAPWYVQRSEAELKFDESDGLSPLARRRAKIAGKIGSQQVRPRSKRRSRK